MPDRADYLARTLLTRRRALEKLLTEDAPDARGAADARREDLVAKVLAVEAGVTDSAVVRRVCGAFPAYRADQEEPEWAQREFADFLRGILSFD